MLNRIFSMFSRNETSDLVKSSRLHWTKFPSNRQAKKMIAVISAMSPVEYATRISRYVEKRRIVDLGGFDKYRFDFMGHNISTSYNATRNLYFVKCSGRIMNEQVWVSRDDLESDLIRIVDTLIYMCLMIPAAV